MSKLSHIREGIIAARNDVVLWGGVVRPHLSFSAFGKAYDRTYFVTFIMRGTATSEEMSVILWGEDKAEKLAVEGAVRRRVREELGI